MKNKNANTNVKKTGKSVEKNTKQKPEPKVNQKQKDFQRLEEYLNESGLSLAFNIIFAELISKQILRENYFTYTSMRLTQIGKEIEGLKTKEIIYVEEEKENKVEENVEEKAEQTDLQPPVVEEKEEIFMTNPPQKPQEKSKEKEKEKIIDKDKKSDGKKTVKKKK